MAILGLVYLAVIFIACFAVVHVIKLAVAGFRSIKHKPAQADEQKPSPPKPVYYIVEKKRAKKTYGKPREISFKDKDA